MIEIDYKTKLLLENDDRNEKYNLYRDLIADYGECTLHVDKGLHTDGASIPRVFWRLIGSPLMGKYRRACIFHDAGYELCLKVITCDGYIVTGMPKLLP